MGIKEVTYREERLISTGQYENIRMCIEAKADVDLEKGAHQTYVECKNFVKEAIRNRVIEHFDKKKVCEQLKEDERIINKYNL